MKVCSICGKKTATHNVGDVTVGYARNAICITDSAKNVEKTLEKLSEIDITA